MARRMKGHTKTDALKVKLTTRITIPRYWLTETDNINGTCKDIFTGTTETVSLLESKKSMMFGVEEKEVYKLKEGYCFLQYADVLADLFSRPEVSGGYERLCCNFDTPYKDYTGLYFTRENDAFVLVGIFVGNTAYAIDDVLVLSLADRLKIEGVL